jgi:hypothetical protein
MDKKLMDYEEKVRLEAFDYIRNEIRRDILEGDPSWFNEKKYDNRPEYERGVRAVMRLITHRIDCILD